MNNISANNLTLRKAYAFPLVVIVALTLLPYLQFGPIGTPTEVQPWAALAAWAMVPFFLVSGRLQITRFTVIILAFSLLFLSFIPLTDEVDLGQYLRKAVAFLLSVSLMIVARYVTPSLIIGVLKPVTLLWLAFAVLGEINPRLYQDVVTPFVPGALGAYGDRGVTSLAPEATDFGFVMVYFWLLAMLGSASNHSSGGPQAPLWLYGAIFVCILLSRSATGVMGLAILLIVRIATYDTASGKSHLSLRTFLIMVSAPAISVLFAQFIPETGVRGIDLLVLSLQSPAELVHTTFSYRIAHNMVGICGMLDSNLLGHGAGTFTVSGIDVYHKYGIGDMLDVQGWYQFNIPHTLQISPLAIFPVIIFEYGVLGAIFLLYVFTNVLNSRIRVRFAVFVLLFLTWAQSFPVSFPLFWFLLGLIQNPFFLLPNASNTPHAASPGRNARHTSRKVIRAKMRKRDRLTSET